MGKYSQNMFTPSLYFSSMLFLHIFFSIQSLHSVMFFGPPGKYVDLSFSLEEEGFHQVFYYEISFIGKICRDPFREIGVFVGQVSFTQYLNVDSVDWASIEYMVRLGRVKGSKDSSVSSSLSGSVGGNSSDVTSFVVNSHFTDYCTRFWDWFLGFYCLNGYNLKGEEVVTYAWSNSVYSS